MKVGRKMLFEKVEKFATLLSFLPIATDQIELFETGENHVHIKIKDEEGDIYEFTCTVAKVE